MITETREYLSVDYLAKDEYFAVRINKDNELFEVCAPQENIKDTFVIAHKQDVAENNDIVVALFNGKQMLKRIVDTRSALLLTEPNKEPIYVGVKDKLLILGKVVETRICLN